MSRVHPYGALLLQGFSRVQHCHMQGRGDTNSMTTQDMTGLWHQRVMPLHDDEVLEKLCKQHCIRCCHDALSLKP